MRKCDKCRNYEPKQPFHYDGGGERTHPEPVKDSLDERFNNVIARLESIRAEILKRNAPKFKAGDWVYGMMCMKLARVESVRKDGKLDVYIPSVDIHYVWVHLDQIRPATRSDFIVKRNGHEWLAEEAQRGHGKIKYTRVFKDGIRVATVYDHEAIPFNLPVCPAEVK